MNQREIKFRAWDKKKSRMIYLGETLFNEWHLQLSNKHWGLFDGAKTTSTCGSGDKTGILMQFTGLRDKNGKEIYEGDLIDYGNGRYRPVEFIYGAFCNKGA